MDSQIQAWLQANGYGECAESQPLAGGSINQTCRLRFADGASLILKSHTHAPKDMFASERTGLEALRQDTGLRVPKVQTHSASAILLEDLGQGDPGTEYWRQLGTGLALMHNKPQEYFGFHCDNYCGTTPQKNPRTEDGFDFFARFRILELAHSAESRGLLEPADMDALYYIAENLRQWIPAQPPVLIHGDLWSGNIHCCADGVPALIDPAAYFGWREAELAMATLFGGFDTGFYEAYAEASDMETDWRERCDLYNIYHLLNHLLLFGVSYLGSLRQSMRRYT